MRKKIKRENRKSAKVFWRVFISAIGALLIIIALNDVALGIFGKTAAADVSVRRVGGADTGASPERQYTWSVDYTFTVNGKEYSGHTSHKGSATSVKFDREVHYYPFAPQINSLDARTVPNIETFLMTGLGTVLLLAMNKPENKRAKKKTASLPLMPGNTAPGIIPAEGGKRVTMAWLMENTTDYDDSVQEYYRNGWDKGDPSWQCRCGKWNEGNFCEKCGSARKQPREP